jgi:hypothetical protein
MPTEMEKRLAAIVDREEIFDLARRERFSRDQRDLATMRACFHDEATIRTSWFDGGVEDYVAATRHRMEKISSGKHWVFPAGLKVVGDRATVESPALIFDRPTLNGVEVDVQVFCRFFSRVERRKKEWRLLTFEVLFERDVMRCVNPAEPLPVDWAAIARYRPSYRFLSFVQESRGTRVNPNLYGDDRPEDLLAFHEREHQWLCEGR